jgi:hypothetical protein
MMNIQFLISGLPNVILTIIRNLLLSQKEKDYTNRNILNYKLFSEPEKQGYEGVLEVLLSEKGIKESNLTANNLGGTQRMFYELYKNMSSTKDRSDVLIFIHGYAYILMMN